MEVEREEGGEGGGAYFVEVEVALEVVVALEDVDDAVATVALFNISILCKKRGRKRDKRKGLRMRGRGSVRSSRNGRRGG